ncbi:helix-turn-helix transcriptional regulator [Rhizobium sp. TRM95796]|uniref:helix-turn-helix transcriptional regulator n=1 Tax=Rhizobium sp. TRM95796 TaxID=2979862 RepID=UPI0021E986B5|nr:helix-turn-helix transcriptional regulator [Rhizobium sp. TRM95796]MCV3766644.1 helix-turn-helix transcriptional regulator [Rhizobium sp. TRM95796]
MVFMLIPGSPDHDRIIDKIYEAALLPDAWQDVLEEICRWGGFFGGLVAMDDVARADWVLTPSVVPIFQEFLDGGWQPRNERLYGLVQSGDLDFVSDSQLYSEADKARIPIYRDFLTPRGFGIGSATIVQAADGRRMSIIFERKLEQGPSPPEILAALNSLRPHMARALNLASEVRRQRQHSLLNGLALAGVPAALITEQGRILAANAVFEGLGDHIAFLAHGRMALRDPAAQLLFTEALTSLGGERVQSLPLPSANEAALPGVLHILPLRRMARDLGPNAQAIVMAAFPTRGDETLFPLLKTLYDFTRAEARVAALMLEGEALPEIAKRLGVAYETVRSGAKAIYRKTGSSGQTDFVRRLSPVTRYSVASGG